jgi:ABC-type multidrug transport system fused ATPase/permease subunit
VLTPGRAPRRHRFLIGTLFVLASLIGFMAINTVWINRQVLNADNWANTSSRVLADKQVQTAVSAYAVNQLFSSGVPQARVKAALPPRLQGLAGPITAGLEQVAGQAAPRILASPKVQTLWRVTNRAALKEFLRIVNGGGSGLSTNGGVVTLNLHAIVDQLAASLGVQQQVDAGVSKLQANSGTVKAGASQLGITLPASAGQIVILRSNQLKAVQDIVKVIKGLAIVLPLVALALFALAVWLSKGRRRRALRTTGWCFFGIGLFVILDRRVLGNAIVSGLVKDPANRPAAHQVWTILTSLLYDIGAAVLVYGLVLVVATWLAGHTRPAIALRRALAPTLRDRPVVAYVVVYAALLLVIIWGPTPATRQLLYIILFVVLLALGVVALTRQTAHEFPEAQAGDTMRSVRAWYAERRGSSISSTAGTSTVQGSEGDRVADLERLASLHDRGSLTDAEFAAEKAALTNAV